MCIPMRLLILEKIDTDDPNWYKFRIISQRYYATLPEKLYNEKVGELEVSIMCAGFPEFQFFRRYPGSLDAPSSWDTLFTGDLKSIVNNVQRVTILLRGCGSGSDYLPITLPSKLTNIILRSIFRASLNFDFVDSGIEKQESNMLIF